MKNFMDDQDFLLSTKTGEELFHNFAEGMPIVDYHCHISPKEIWDDKRFENITEVWLGGDHYKWRLMRANGVDERFITGDAPAREKFQKWAETLGRCVGNPVFEWSHLELKRYFGYEGVLNGKTAQEVWDLANAKLAEASFTCRNLIKQSNVLMITRRLPPTTVLTFRSFPPCAPMPPCASSVARSSPTTASISPRLLALRSATSRA